MHSFGPSKIERNKQVTGNNFRQVKAVYSSGKTSTMNLKPLSSYCCPMRRCQIITLYHRHSLDFHSIRSTRSYFSIVAKVPSCGPTSCLLQLLRINLAPVAKHANHRSESIRAHSNRKDSA